jgi:site-specific DNA-methyltransferase (adenine-specific)
LFDQDAYQFQFWAVGLIGAQPFGAGSTNKKGKKGGDGGIDGLLFFRTPGGERVDKAIVSVKGGKNLAPNMIRDLDSVVSQQKAAIGVFITLHEPTSGMLESAAKMGVYEYGGVRVPKIQIRTIEQLLSGYRPDIPQGSLNVSLEAKEQQTLEKESKRRNQASLFESNSK